MVAAAGVAILAGAGRLVAVTARIRAGTRVVVTAVATSYVGQTSWASSIVAAAAVASVSRVVGPVSSVGVALSSFAVPIAPLTSFIASWVDNSGATGSGD